jgi:hypothetical protein
VKRPAHLIGGPCGDDLTTARLTSDAYLLGAVGVVSVRLSRDAEIDQIIVSRCELAESELGILSFLDSETIEIRPVDLHDSSSIELRKLGSPAPPGGKNAPPAGGAATISSTLE